MRRTKTDDNAADLNSSMTDETPRELFFKFILIGDAGLTLYYHLFNIYSGVGKTSIVKRYTENTFDKDYRVTVGAEFASKFVDIDESTRIKLQIWDTVFIILLQSLINVLQAGMDSFVNIIRSFYKDSHGVFLVYDVNRYVSLLDYANYPDVIPLTIY